MVAKSTAAVARGRAQQAHAREEEGDHDGGEDFEEAFDPEVHHPPAPVFGDRQVRVPAPHQTRAVEEPRSRRELRKNSASRWRLSTRPADRRPQRAAHQSEPDEQSDEQEDLPESAEIDVLVALMAEPEVRHEAELLLHRRATGRPSSRRR